MNLTLHHRNVSMNIAIASVIARKLYELEKTLGITDAIVILELTGHSSFSILVRAEIGACGSYIEAEGADPQPGTALIKLMGDLQNKSQRDLNPADCFVSSQQNRSWQLRHAPAANSHTIQKTEMTTTIPKPGKCQVQHRA